MLNLNDPTPIGRHESADDVHNSAPLTAWVGAAWNAGLLAASYCRPLNANPYQDQTRRRAWLVGYDGFPFMWPDVVPEGGRHARPERRRAAA